MMNKMNLKKWSIGALASFLVIGSFSVSYIMTSKYSSTGNVQFPTVQELKNMGIETRDTVKSETEITSPFYGNKDSKVQVTVYIDLQCPACIMFNKIVLPNIMKKYVDTNQIGINFKHYPLGYHKRAIDYANLSLCAHKNGKFKEFKDYAYSFEEKYGAKDRVMTDLEVQMFASQNKINPTEMIQCRKDMTYGYKILEDAKEAEKAGIKGTPSIAINGKIVNNIQKEEDFYTAIDSVIKETILPISGTGNVKY